MLEKTGGLHFVLDTTKTHESSEYAKNFTLHNQLPTVSAVFGNGSDIWHGIHKNERKYLIEVKRKTFTTYIIMRLSRKKLKFPIHATILIIHRLDDP